MSKKSKANKNTSIFFSENCNDLFNYLIPEYEELYKSHKTNGLTGVRSSIRYSSKLLAEFSQDIERKYLGIPLDKAVYSQNDFYGVAYSVIYTWAEQEGEFYFTERVLAVFLMYILLVNQDQELGENVRKKLSTKHFPEKINLNHFLKEIVKIDKDKAKVVGPNVRGEFNDYFGLLAEKMNDIGIKILLNIDEHWEFNLSKSPNKSSDKNVHKNIELPRTNIPYQKPETTNYPKQIVNFCKSIENEYKEIKLDVVNFKMPIQNFVNLPLLKQDEFLSNELKQLEHRYNKCDNREDKESLSKKITKINSILNKEHDIIDIVNLKKDVFIEAPAGEGKSTLLKWLTYKFAKENSKKYLPIFIELKLNTKNNLREIIDKKLKRFNIELSTNEGSIPLVLLDGYDEFTGDDKHLFKEIIELKEDFGVQIIMSGRIVPKFTRIKWDFAIYELSPLSDENIKSLFHLYLGSFNGEKHYTYVISRGLQKNLERPLYLIFLLAYLKKKIDYGIFDSDEIAQIIVNKGRLFQTLIIDEFIKKYEGFKTEIEIEKWKEQKDNEIELIAQLGYWMTYKLSNVEAVKKREAISYLVRISVNSKQEVGKIIDAFIKHNILTFSDGLISYDKKEFRFFFTSLYIKSSINSFKSLSQQKNVLLNKKNGENSWHSIEQYLIGIIEPDKILSAFQINFNNPPILNKDIFRKFELSLKFVHQKNYPIEHSHVNEQFLIQFIKFLTRQRELIDSSKKKSILFFVGTPFLASLLKKIHFPTRYVPKKIINIINLRFFYSEQLHYPYKVNGIIQNLIRYDLKLTFEEVYQIASSFDDSYFEGKKYFYDSLIRHNKAICLRLTLEEKMDLAYEYIFKFQNSNKYRDIFKFNSVAIKLSMDDFLEEYPNEFLNTVFNRSPNLFTFKRYLHFRIKRRSHAFFEDINSKKIDKQNQQFLIGFLKRIFLSENERVLSVFYRFKFKFNDLITNQLLATFIDVIFSNEYSFGQRVNAFRFVFEFRCEKETTKLEKIYQDNDDDILKIGNKAFESIFSDPHYLWNFIKSDYQIDFYSVILLSKKVPISLKENIIVAINKTNENLNTTIIYLMNDSFYKPFLELKCLFFIGKYKVKKAVPYLIEKLQDGLANLNAYESLYKIDCKYYFLFKNNFTHRYENLMEFLESHKRSPVLENKRIFLVEAMSLGDKKMLHLISDLAKNYLQNFNDKDKDFLKIIEKHLIEKTETLSNCKGYRNT